MNATSSFPIKFDSNYNDMYLNCNKSCRVTYISRNLFVNPSMSSIRKTRNFSSAEKNKCCHRSINICNQATLYECHLLEISDVQEIKSFYWFCMDKTFFELCRFFFTIIKLIYALTPFHFCKTNLIILAQREKMNV